jgi:hypothetical protein
VFKKKKLSSVNNFFIFLTLKDNFIGTNNKLENIKIINKNLILPV